MSATSTRTFLLVQEIPDEATFNRLLENVRPLKSFPIGSGDKLRLIFSEEGHAELEKRLFAGMDAKTKALLVPIAETAFSPASLQAL